MTDGDYLKMNRGRASLEAIADDGLVTLRLTGAQAPIAVLDFDLTAKEADKLRAFLTETLDG